VINLEGKKKKNSFPFPLAVPWQKDGKGVLQQPKRNENKGLKQKFIQEWKFCERNDIMLIFRWLSRGLALCEWVGCLTSMCVSVSIVCLGQAQFVCKNFTVWEGVNACGLSSPVQGDDRMFMWLLCVCGWVLLCTVWVMGVGCDYRHLVPRTHSTSVWHNSNKPTRSRCEQTDRNGPHMHILIASFMKVHMLMSANSNMSRV